MTAQTRREALDWLAEAKNDLKRAQRALQHQDHAHACFMSQQACEKALKALHIALLRTTPPRTHDLTQLHHQLPDRAKLPAPTADTLVEVSQYYVTARYPNAGLQRPSESITRTQATRALQVAETTVKHAENLLEVLMNG